MASVTLSNSEYSEDLKVLRTYCEAGNALELEKCLVHYAGDINMIFHDSYNNTLLHIAVKSGSLECVQVLLNRGAKPDVTNKDKNTALHFAAQFNSPECLKCLLQAVAKSFDRKNSQNTPLQYGAKACSTTSFKLLIDSASQTGSSSHDMKREVNLPNLNKRIPLHLAALSGCVESIKLLVENKSDISVGDESENTPLHLAAISGSADSVKYLIENGADLLVENKDKHTALYMVLNNLPNGEDILREILEECIEVTKLSNGKEEFEVSLRALCPKTRNKMALVNRLYSHHRYNKPLLLHPVLKTLIGVEWNKSRYVVWYRFISYLLYLLMLSLFVTSSPDSVLSTVTRVLACFLSVHVIVFCFPYLLPGQFSMFRRISKTLLTVIPPTLTIVATCIPYNAEWCGVSFLLSWLSIPFYSSAIYLISHQTGMFLFVTKEIVKHSLIFLFFLVGFSLTFYVLYYDDSNESFNNFWRAFLYTTLVLLQGDRLGDYETFGSNNTEEAQDDDGYISYVTEALSNMRFASIITSLLFVLVVIIALLNMLVALAVRGGEELMEYGQIYHLWNQTQLLYEWHEVKRVFRRFHKAKPDEQTCAEGYVTIRDKEIPLLLRYELSVVANYKNKIKGPNFSNSAMEAVLNEKISALMCEIRDLKESQKMALKKE
jgi:ankyrin repeat protein